MPFDFARAALSRSPIINVSKTLDSETLPEGWYYLPDAEPLKTRLLIDPDRTILGADQEQWLDAELQASKAARATWQILGQQVLMGKLGLPVLTDEELNLRTRARVSSSMQMMQTLAKDALPFNLDAWDGYAACRDRVFELCATWGESGCASGRYPQCLGL